MAIHLTLEELNVGLASVGDSPKDGGRVEMIVSRPMTGERLVMEQAELDTEHGLLGDNWESRGSNNTEDGMAHPDMQIAIMNSRIIHLVAQDKSRWALAGDQLFLDLDLSLDNLPAGQQLAIGSAVLEISDIPHNGCAKFTERFGRDATRFVNSIEGKPMRRRGVNTRVIKGGIIRVGDTVSKLSEHEDSAEGLPAAEAARVS